MGAGLRLLAREVQIEDQDQIRTKELVDYDKVHLRLLTIPRRKLAQQVILTVELGWQKSYSLPATKPSKIKMHSEQPSAASSPTFSRKCHLIQVGLAAYQREGPGHRCTVEGDTAAVVNSLIIWVQGLEE